MDTVRSTFSDYKHPFITLRLVKSPEPGLLPVKGTVTTIARNVVIAY